MPLQVNISKIICINLSSLNIDQIFSISEYHKLSFEGLVKLKNDNVFKLWVESNGNVAVAVSHTSSKDRILWNDAYSSPTSKEYKKIINTPVSKVPKIPKTIEAKNNYNFFKSNGHEINLKCFEKKSVEKKVYFNFDISLDKIIWN